MTRPFGCDACEKTVSYADESGKHGEFNNKVDSLLGPGVCFISFSVRERPRKQPFNTTLQAAKTWWYVCVCVWAFIVYMICKCGGINTDFGVHSENVWLLITIKMCPLCGCWNWNHKLWGGPPLDGRYFFTLRRPTMERNLYFFLMMCESNLMKQPWR